MSERQVLVRDISSGRVHRRIDVDGQLYSLESCNADDAGKAERIDSLAGVPFDDLCGNCWPGSSRQSVYDAPDEHDGQATVTPEDAA